MVRTVHLPVDDFHLQLTVSSSDYECVSAVYDKSENVEELIRGHLNYKIRVM